jgi:DNA-binding response OmpR family regulator
MSMEVVPGGQRRIDRVLGPRFPDGVERLDLVILDLTMPRLDGLGTWAALRSDPELAGTQVLVLTGRDQPDDRAAARDADAYLVKPFSSLVLLDAVKRLTDG